MAKGKATKTRIARKTGLNFQRASGYLDLLFATGHIQTSFVEGQRLQVLSEKGQRFLSGLETMKHDMDELFTLPRPLAPLIAGLRLQTGQRIEPRLIHVLQGSQRST